MLAGLGETDLLVLGMPADSASDSLVQMPITRDGRIECTWAGTFPDAEYWAMDLPPEVVRLIMDPKVWAVDVIDLAWGRNDLLWPCVLDALRQRPQRLLPHYLAGVWESAPDNSRFVDE